MTDAERLTRIEDREAIRDLLASYCYAIAAKDVERVLALFVPDCRVEVLGNVYSGESGLRALYADSLTVDPKPFVHNHWIELRSEAAARGKAVFEIRQTREGTPESSVGCYEDEYAKEGGVWRFQRRTFAFY